MTGFELNQTRREQGMEMEENEFTIDLKFLEP